MPITLIDIKQRWIQYAEEHYWSFSKSYLSNFDDDDDDFLSQDPSFRPVIKTHFTCWIMNQLTKPRWAHSTWKFIKEFLLVHKSLQSKANLIFFVLCPFSRLEYVLVWNAFQAHQMKRSMYISIWRWYMWNPTYRFKRIPYIDEHEEFHPIKMSFLGLMLPVDLSCHWEYFKWLHYGSIPRRLIIF